MKAFLSHSSTDKDFVSKVVEKLGSTEIEYDEKTFEFTLNVQAIRAAMSRSDLFVLFLSQNSIESFYVKEEQRAALEGRGKGVIKHVMIFSLDNTAYSQLPEWMREINVVRRLSSPKACARRIQATLISLDAQSRRDADLYLGRDEDERLLRKALSAPAATTPIAIHAVGHQGIGRTTFLRRTLGALYPRYYQAFVSASFGKYDGIEEFYRTLYDIHVSSPLSVTIAAFDAFANREYSEKIHLIVEMIIEMASDGEFLCIVDDGGVYDDSGDYQDFLKSVIKELEHFTRPVLAFVQTRMMPLFRREAYPRSFHIYLRPLDQDSVVELLSFGLKELDIDFSNEQVKQIASHLDGHPYNVRFAIRYIEAYGIDSLLYDPSELIEWKRRRAEDFLDRLEFNQRQSDIMALLAEYRYLATDMIIDVLGDASDETAKDLRRLEEFCCIERRDGYFHISAPIKEAIRRDSRFERSDDWKQGIGRSICDSISEYEDDDFVSVPILESATLAAAKGAQAPAFLSRLILPSHLLRIARDFYDRGRRRECIEFCARAYEMRSRLPVEGQVEVLRLWGLSAIRLNDGDAYNRVLDELEKYAARSARRVFHFLRGFNYRQIGNWDEAEAEFLDAWRLAKNNQSINRELASVYCKLQRYNEAETHARAAYQVAPTNPFVLDIVAETLLGKAAVGLPVDRDEIAKILAELKVYGDAPGSSFFLIREAQKRAKDGNLRGALEAVDRGIERTPTLIAARFIRADVCLKMGNVTAAEKELEVINRLLTEAGGFSEGNEAEAHEIQVRISLDKLQFRAAKDQIDRSAFLPASTASRLRQKLARAIAFEPQAADPELREWAKKYDGKGRGKSQR